MLDLTFPQTATSENPRVGLHQVFLGVDPGKTFSRPELHIEPNKSIEVPLSPRHHDIEKLVEFRLRIENVAQMEVRIHQALFDDGTMFETGVVYRRNPDPKDTRRWIKLDNE